MPIFLPVARLSIDGLWLIGTGAVVGFLSGLLGVGGGFLITPILMMIGIPPTIASASGTNSMVATSASGVAAHFRRGNVDIKMGLILLLGGLIGADIGVEIIKVLRALGNADVLIKLTYVVVLGGVGGLMFVQSIRNLRHSPVMGKPSSAVQRRHILSRLPFQMTFPRSGVRHSVLVPFALCVLVGMLAGIMGVGGGFLMVPLMVYLLHMPPHVAVGTDLFQILFTCAGATLMQATTNHIVDVVLALMVAAGSTIGAQIGAAVSKLLRGEQLMILLATLALAVVGKISVDLVSKPGNLLRLETGEQETADLASLPSPGQAEFAGGPAGTGTLKVIPQQIEMGATYSGQNVRIEGFAAPGSQVVVVAAGPDTQERFEHVGRAGPIWVTRGTVKISGVPSLFIRFAPKPVEQFLSRDQIDRRQLDLAAIRGQMRIRGGGEQGQAIRQDFIRLKVAQNVYRLVDGAIETGPPGPSGMPYSVAFHWPRKASPGTYEIRAYECREGVVANAVFAPLHVRNAGLPAAIDKLSAEHAALYGALAVLTALLAGFGMDCLVVRLRKWIGAVRRSRPGGPRPAVEEARAPGGRAVR